MQKNIHQLVSGSSKTAAALSSTQALGIKVVFKKTAVCMAVLQMLALPSVSLATEYVNTINTAKTTLSAGDSVVTHDRNGVYGNGTLGGKAIDVANGAIAIYVDSDLDSVRGINIADLKGNHLGTGSTIAAKGSNKVGVITGLSLVQNNTLAAERLSVHAEGEKQAMGMNVVASNNHIDLGTASGIHATAQNLSSAMYVTGENNAITANVLTLSSSANMAYGLLLGAGSAEVNLGSGSIITAQSKNQSPSSQAAGIKLGVEGLHTIHADQLTIQAQGKKAYGVQVVGSKDTSLIDLGKGSVIDVTGDVGAGVLFDAAAKGSLTASDLHINAQGAKVNAIEAQAGQVSIAGASHLYSEQGAAIKAAGSGQVHVNIENGAHIMGALHAADDGRINLNAASSQIVGQATVAGNGVINVHMTDGTVWNALMDSTVSKLIMDDSSLYIAKDPLDPFKGNVFTVTGDYEGQNGHLYFDTVLGDDESATDKLMIIGDSAGQTLVSVNNLGGKGAQTTQGIELIEVLGDSKGEFKQDGRIVAGAYDYYLVRGQKADAGNWYLVNTIDTPGPGVEEPGSGNEDPGDGGTKTTVLRPEAGIYTSHLAAANTMFGMRLHDRLGETHYVDALAGQDKATSLWIRQLGGHNRFKDGTEQLTTKSNRYMVQIGSDIAQWHNSNQSRMHIGVMGGYAYHNTRSASQPSGHQAKGKMEGASVGLYGTWLQDKADKTGYFLDTWAQYQWFNNTVKGDQIQTEKYQTKGLTASVELGYTALVQGNDEVQYYIQPKAQAVWMGVGGNHHFEQNGTRVKFLGQHNVQTSFGVRVFMHQASKNAQKQVQPFIEANWLHNTKTYGVNMDDVVIREGRDQNLAELKMGVEAQLNPNTTLWVNAALQKGSHGYTDVLARLGLKYALN